ncbi:MAG TPA: hypothetical protein VK968_08405, partial [Roseimicrobium sp.]|nr:hypothetical protein [Roseimicrobium sp.]
GPISRLSPYHRPPGSWVIPVDGNWAGGVNLSDIRAHGVATGSGIPIQPMSFFGKFTLAASVVASAGMFFVAVGVRQLIRSRAGFPWSTAIRESFREMLGRRPASGKGKGLYFSLFGVFLMVVCASSVGLLWLTQFAAPKRAALHDELRIATGFKGPLNWYASERSESGAGLVEHHVDFAFSYPEGWMLETQPAVGNDSVFVSARRPAIQGSSSSECFFVATLTSISAGEPAASSSSALAELKIRVTQLFPYHEQLRTGNRGVGLYEGPGFDFAVLGASGQRTGSFGRAVAFAPAVTRQPQGVSVVMVAKPDSQAAPPEDVGKLGELPVLVQSFRLGLDHRHKTVGDIKAATPTR